MNSHPIRVTNTDDFVRSRLTVFFRLVLAVPHVIWLELWAIVMIFVAIASWFATLFSGRNPDALHRFSAAFVRYGVHVNSFTYLVANPFPGFVGAEGTYPIDVLVAAPEMQNRWKTFFRLFLALPAAIISGLLGYALYAVGAFGWFAALATGRMPTGLQRFGVYALRYQAQINGYALLLCDHYPYSGPESEWTDQGAGASGASLVPPPAAHGVEGGPAPGTLATPKFRDAPAALPQPGE